MTRIWGDGQDLAQNEKKELESLIDKHGIESVLMALSDICGQKSEHIAEYWQDASLAKRWATICGAIGCAVPMATGL